MTFTILVTGDRGWDNPQTHGRVVQDILYGYRKHNPIIVHGAARGVDTIADLFARAFEYEVRPYPADWAQYHKAAGPIRNTQMLQEKPDLVLAFHDDLSASKGTKNMVNQAVKAGIPTIHITSAGKRTVITAKVP
jgi:hypothetical protein